MSERRWTLTDRERESRRVETIERLANEKEAALRERDEAWQAARQIVSAYREAEDMENFEWWLEEEAYPLWPWLKEEPSE